MSFTVLPYAALLHHAAFGDLQDFRIGERAIFRLHENEAGEWVWLTYIQDRSAGSRLKARRDWGPEIGGRNAGVACL